MDELSIREAFKNVKQDTESLQNQLNKANTAISIQNQVILELKEEISHLKTLIEGLKANISIGNEGVQAINHSTIQAINRHINQTMMVDSSS